MNDEPFCCRCTSDFPVSEEPAAWTMGKLRALKKAPRKIVDQFRDWLGHPAGAYLCGNCYFDLTD